MKRGIIKVDARHTVRNMRSAIQGSVIRALVELITNADDSYIRMENAKHKVSGVIEIIYHKKSYTLGVFGVRDEAEGMDADTVERCFTVYGGSTSGLKTGKRVRGYFGQGAKDALGGMKDGRVCTVKDGNFVECKIFLDHEEPMYEISDAVNAKSDIRKTHSILGNGTVAYFSAESPAVVVPQFDTIHEDLANNHQLRKIMTNPNRKVILTNINSRESRPIRYALPSGKEILSDRFPLKYASYPEIPVSIKMYRADYELTQFGDNRTGGLLIIDEANAVLDLSLFKFNNEPLASRFYGEVKIENFRQLLDAEEPVLQDDRTGLVPRHPFCQKLISEIEKRIDIKVKEEAARKEQENQNKIDQEETQRFSKAFNFLNQIAEVEAKQVQNLGQLGATDQEPPNGFCLYPDSAEITVGKLYSLELALNTKVVHHGSKIALRSSHPKINIKTPEITISKEDGTGILRKFITIEGVEPNVRGIIKASVGSLETASTINVIPEKEVLYSEGMVFQPESITLYPNQPKRIHLLVYVKMIEGGSRIRLTSDNPAVHISKHDITASEKDSMRNVAKYELEVWGDGVGETAIIQAECNETFYALMQVKVVSKEEREDKARKGMFSEPWYDYGLEPLQRSSYSAENGKVIIYVNFPTILHYLGANREFAKSLPAQVLVADLVAERCFLEIAKKKAESASVVRAGAVHDLIQRYSFELSRKYGKKVHEHLVDQEALKKSKSQAKTDGLTKTFAHR